MSFIGASQSVTRGDVVELLALLEELRASQAPATGTVDDKGNVKINPSGAVSHEQIKRAVQERWVGR